MVSLQLIVEELLQFQQFLCKKARNFKRSFGVSRRGSSREEIDIVLPFFL
jgi:hypothetical protein